MYKYSTFINKYYSFPNFTTAVPAWDNTLPSTSGPAVTSSIREPRCKAALNPLNRTQEVPKRSLAKNSLP